ncbi:MAG: chitinase [Mycobacteriales bacterium]|jgi:chitinase
MPDQRSLSNRLVVAATAAALLAGVGLAMPGASAAAAGAGATSAGPAGAGAGGPVADRGGRYRKVGYFVQWGIYGRAFFPKDVETTGMASRLNTIDYAFENVGADGRCFEANAAGVGDAFADYQRSYDAASSVDGVADTWDQPLRGNFNQLRELKARHPNLSVLVSLGGWSFSKYFSDAALTPASRRAFAASCIDLFIKGNLPQLAGDPAGGPGAAAGVFDGIDLDWEWPGSDGNAGNIIRPEDKRNYGLLMAEIRRQLDAYGRRTHRHYALSAFLPAAPAKISAGVDVRSVFRSLDWATVQGYDLHGTWETGTNHQAQLFSPAADPAPERFSADQAIRSYLRAGAPAGKLLLGIPYYGRGWAGVPDVNHGLYQPGTGPAPATFDAGVEDYKVLKTLPGQRFTDRRAGATWLYDGSTFWSYDDLPAIAAKTRYVTANRLGGTMVWELDGDDGTLTAAIANGLR